jgi:hypothetical protein
METLPAEIVYEIGKYLGNDIVNFSMVNKKFYDMFEERKEEAIKLIQEYNSLSTQLCKRIK